jgi:hypothetical protein
MACGGGGTYWDDVGVRDGGGAKDVEGGGLAGVKEGGGAGTNDGGGGGGGGWKGGGCCWDMATRRAYASSPGSICGMAALAA